MIANWLPEDFLKTIVLFELPNEKDELVPHGTGVLVNYNQIFILITCKHIALNPQTNEEYKGLIVTLNTSDGQIARKSVSAIQEQFKLRWFYHSNESIDLAVSPIALEEGKDDFKLISLDLFEKFLNIPLGEDVFFLGYPLGLGAANVSKLSPLIRSGMVALKNSDKSFLIDANVYPGSSGSPVFYKPTLAQKDKGSVAIGNMRAMKFIGIVNSNISTVEEAISRKTGRVRTVFEENSGLGTVFSATLIEEILETEEFKKILPTTENAQEEVERVDKETTKINT